MGHGTLTRSRGARFALLVLAVAALGAAFVSRELPLILLAQFGLVVAVARWLGVFDGEGRS